MARAAGRLTARAEHRWAGRGALDVVIATTQSLTFAVGRNSRQSAARRVYKRHGSAHPGSRPERAERRDPA